MSNTVGEQKELTKEEVRDFFSKELLRIKEFLRALSGGEFKSQSTKASINLFLSGVNSYITTRDCLMNEQYLDACLSDKENYVTKYNELLKKQVDKN